MVDAAHHVAVLLSAPDEVRDDIIHQPKWHILVRLTVWQCSLKSAIGGVPKHAEVQ